MVRELGREREGAHAREGPAGRRQVDGGDREPRERSRGAGAPPRQDCAEDDGPSERYAEVDRDCREQQTRAPRLPPQRDRARSERRLERVLSGRECPGGRRHAAQHGRDAAGDEDVLEGGARERVAGAPGAHGYDDAVATASPTDPLRALLERAFPDADEVAVIDRTGGGDHFHVTVASPRFDGLTLVEQHRLVYDALAGPLADGTIHELRIKTRAAAGGDGPRGERTGS